jgi:hypothetical protein
MNPKQGQHPNQPPPKPSCQHPNFFLNAIGQQDHDDGTVTVYYHWWCEDCNSGWTDIHDYDQKDYYRRDD